jgi:hypothetical protein
MPFCRSSPVDKLLTDTCIDTSTRPQNKRTDKGSAAVEGDGASIPVIPIEQPQSSIVRIQNACSGLITANRAEEAP